MNKPLLCQATALSLKDVSLVGGHVRADPQAWATSKRWLVSLGILHKSRFCCCAVIESRFVPIGRLETTVHHRIERNRASSLCCVAVASLFHPVEQLDSTIRNIGKRSSLTFYMNRTPSTPYMSGLRVDFSQGMSENVGPPRTRERRVRRNRATRARITSRTH